jgi:hypothetical protein
MTISYKLIKIDLAAKTIQNIKKLDTETEVCLFIPFDPANVDYIAYLAWIAEGNVPEEA